MAAPKKSRVSPSESDYCEETDVFSANFDPLRALYDENVRLPFPEAEPFADMSKFVDHLNRQTDTGQCSRLPDDGPMRSVLTDKSDIAHAQKVSFRQRFGTFPPWRKGAKPMTKCYGGMYPWQNDTVFQLLHRALLNANQVISQDKRQTRKLKTVLSVMEDAEGPLSLLAWSKENKKKIKVCTRTFKGLRGICVGYVVAFDKFLNLALVDVDEIYRKPPLGQAIYHQEILTFSKIMEHFTTRKKMGGTKKLEPTKKKTRNRKERKVRLEAKLTAEGVFIENYHPPPVSTDPDTRERDGVTETYSEMVPPNDAGRIARLQRLTENIFTSGNETTVESNLGKTVARVETCVSSKVSIVTPMESDVTKGGSLAMPVESDVVKGRTDSSLKKRGKDVIKHEDFLWRHVRQIFLRGDNIVLIAVDKTR